jgi:signal transduction histidine kinase
MAILGQLSGGIIHDFRNILAVIDSGLNLAQDQAANLALRNRHLATVREGVERGLVTVSRLLELARDQSFAPSLQNMSDLIAQLSTFLRYGAGPHIRVVFALSPNLPRLLIDPQQFDAAILNLVVNARDAMPDGGVIHIRADMVAIALPERPEQRLHVRVRIQDNGHGMSPHVRRKIFHHYFTTKHGTGSGLGVPQVCAFMKKMGGFVNIDTHV